MTVFVSLKTFFSTTRKCVNYFALGVILKITHNRHNMADRKDGVGKGAYVNIQRNTDSMANPDTMFEKMINNQNKSLEIVMEDSSSPVKRHNTHYVEMSLFDTFYEDYMDFKNYIRDILDARYRNVAAENKLVSDEKESYFWTIKLATLEEKINVLSKENEHLKGEIESANGN